MLSRTPAPSADLRAQPHAYISCGRNLYYVMQRAVGGELMLEDCMTLKADLSSERHVLAECLLVRAAVPAQGYQAPNQP